MLDKLKGLSHSLKLNHPAIIQAPMAGGITTPELVASVSNNKGLGSYASGYVPPSTVLKDIQIIKALTDNPFAVNLFIHQHPNINSKDISKFNTYLNQYRAKLGLDIQTSIPTELVPVDHNEEIIDIIIEQKVAIVSFTFGILSNHLIQKLKKNNIIIMGTATSLEEAQQLEKTGVDAIIAQGSEAGGHQGGFINTQAGALKSTLTLLPHLANHISVPIIAAGGIMNGSGIISAFSLGASGVQMGTAFLTTFESGASALYKQQLILAKNIAYDPTRLTKAYTGKKARGLVNTFMQDTDTAISCIPPYPITHSLTSPIRKEALKQNNYQMMSLWSGQGVSEITQNLTVSDLMKTIYSDIQKTLNNLHELRQSNFI